MTRLHMTETIKVGLNVLHHFLWGDTPECGQFSKLFLMARLHPRPSQALPKRSQVCPRCRWCDQGCPSGSSHPAALRLGASLD